MIDLPPDARLTIGALEALAPELNYHGDRDGYKSRAEKGVVLALTPTHGIRWSGQPGIWYVQSLGQPSVWYEVNLGERSCTDTRPFATFGCGDSQSGRAPLCWHMVAAAVAEAARLDATRDEAPAPEPLRTVKRRRFVWEKDRKHEPVSDAEREEETDLLCGVAS